MEKINTEIFLSSLFCAGFNRIDSLLYTYILGQFFLDNQKSQEFEFVDDTFSKVFLQFVEFDGKVYKLKYNYTIDTDISPIEGYHRTIGETLKTNKKLIDYLINLDLKEIVIKKLYVLGIEQIENWSLLLSEKEKEVIYNIFDNNEVKKKEFRRIF